MEEESALFIVAEVSIGLAGFTGVVAALQGRDGWDAFDVWRVVSLLCITFSCLFVSLMPVGLHAAGLSDSAVWRFSGGFGIASIVFGYIVTTRYQRADFPRQQGAYAKVLYSLGGALLVWHILTILLATFWPFFFALLTILMLAALEFTSILLLRPPR